MVARKVGKRVFRMAEKRVCSRAAKKVDWMAVWMAQKRVDLMAF